MSVTLTKVTAILRGYNLEAARKICIALKETKEIRNVEITLNSESAYEIITQISTEFGKDLNIGAGTVMTIEQAKKAYLSGATFFLSPTVLEKEIISFSRERDILTISGAFSATEVHQAFESGADIVKIFPASSLEKSYFKDLKAPLGNLPLMAVGGVNKENAGDYLKNGADYLGVGGIFGKVDSGNNSQEGLVFQALEFEKQMRNGE